MVVQEAVKDDERLVRGALNVIVEPGHTLLRVVPFDELDSPRPGEHWPDIEPLDEYDR
ncbi:MAG: hypothetical protein ACYSVY_08430 [Planctomycetota bacterium]|jgi:hypothetical protein